MAQDCDLLTAYREEYDKRVRAEGLLKKVLTEIRRLESLFSSDDSIDDALQKARTLSHKIRRMSR